MTSCGVLHSCTAVPVRQRPKLAERGHVAVCEASGIIAVGRVLDTLHGCFVEVRG